MMKMFLLLFLLLCIIDVKGYLYISHKQGNDRYISKRSRISKVSTKTSDSNDNDNDNLGSNFLTRSLFIATEIFGKMTSLNNNVGYISTNSKRKSVEQVGEAIKAEYEQIFWATVRIIIAIINIIKIAIVIIIIFITIRVIWICRYGQRMLRSPTLFHHLVEVDRCLGSRRMLTILVNS